MSFKPYRTEIDRFLKAPGGPVGRHMNFVARTVASESEKIARERGLVRSQRYARGFKVRVDRDGKGFFFTVYNKVTGQKPRRGQDYASVIEFGSDPHPIKPRSKNKWLVFRRADGRLVKTKLVNHPGTKARHVMRDALDRASRIL